MKATDIIGIVCFQIKMTATEVGCVGCVYLGVQNKQGGFFFNLFFFFSYCKGCHFREKYRYKNVLFMLKSVHTSLGWVC